MSLIHDALRGESHPITRVPVSVRGHFPRHLLWLAAGVVLAAPVAFLFARAGQAPAGAAPIPHPGIVMPVEAVIAASPTRVEPKSVPPMEAPLSQIVMANAHTAAHPPTNNTTTASGQLPPATSSATTQPPAPSIRITHASSNSRSTGEEPNPSQVHAVMSRLQAAVGNGDIAARDNTLLELQSILPADSLTLLRARAWSAHGSGDTTQAQQHYIAILQRLPDDEHAGVNLALLDARRGDIEQAHARLARLTIRNKRSPMVSQALTELEALRE